MTCIDNGNPLLANPTHCASAGPPVTLNGVVKDARFQNSIVRQVPRRGPGAPAVAVTSTS